MNVSNDRLLGLVLVASTLGAAPTVQADLIDDLLGTPNFGMSWGGMVRNETAIKITGDENPYNQRGNLFNGVSVDRHGSLVPLPETFSDTVVRPVEPSDTTLNLQMMRGELNGDITFFKNLRLRVKLRAVGDPDIYDDQFDLDDVARGTSGRAPDPLGRLKGEPNFYEYRYDSGPALSPAFRNLTEPNDQNNPAFEAAQRAKVDAKEGSSPLEWAGRQYMVDLPSLYFDYQNGPLLIRAGNQQIAWGEMLFFRVLDVANGLDLRRHLILDIGVEEFADERIPSLGVRTSYIVPHAVPLLGSWEVDAFVQRFRPTILTNPNTPYNVIPTQFTVQDQFEQYDDEFNYGVRMKGPVDMPFLGLVDMTLMAARRYAHNGVMLLTDSDNPEGLNPNGAAGVGGVGGAFEGLFAGELADSTFDTDPTGFTSASEFAMTTAMARIDHFSSLNTEIREHAGTNAVAAEASTEEEQRQQEDFFTQVSGGLRGHVRREYERENNFGLGFNYRFEGNPDSILFDQINISLEAKYTPDRKFLTQPTLTPYREDLIEEDEYEIALVFQKFVRYSATFPAAFSVLQYLHRSESDLFQRHLSGYGADIDIDKAQTFEDQGAEAFRPDGIGSANYVVFAFQQPFPNRIWHIDFASLLDVRGGLLVQPGLTWKPNTAWSLKVFANWIDTIYGDPLDNTLSTFQFADEITTRVEYQF